MLMCWQLVGAQNQNLQVRRSAIPRPRYHLSVFAPAPSMAPKVALLRDESRSDHALAHSVMFYLKKALRDEQHQVGKSRVDLGPWAMGVWSTWDALDSIPHLRISTGFPSTNSFIHSLKLQTVQMIGACCLEERAILHQQLTVSERQLAADVRGVIIHELNAFPCWIEARKDLLSVGLQKVLARFLNAILECHYEMFHIVPDAVFSTLANRVAEACLRCQFQWATNSPVIASATPPGTPTRTSRPASSAQALGFGPPHDPNLDPNLLRAPPITDPPSTHLTGGTTLGVYATAATGGTAEGHDDDDGDSGDMSH